MNNMRCYLVISRDKKGAEFRREVKAETPQLAAKRVPLSRKLWAVFDADGYCVLNQKSIRHPRRLVRNRLVWSLLEICQ